MSKLLKATANADNYTVTAEFEGGNIIVWNMCEKVKSIRFAGLAKPDVFRNIVVEGKKIFWPQAPDAMALTVDEMIFSIRE